MSKKIDALFIEVPANERIKPGDWVERRWGDGFRREYKAKKGKDGNLVVKYRSGKYWCTDDYPPDEFHRFWRKVTESPAVRFVRLLHHKTREKSTQKQPHLIRKAIELAVEAQMRFDVDDFEVLRRYCTYYGEDEYRFVIESGNVSALAALEKFMEREPFWFDPAGDGEKKRLYVGAYFKWVGLDVKVTSIKDSDNLIACHQRYDREACETKTLRVFRISRGDLAQFTNMRRTIGAIALWVRDQNPIPLAKLSYIHKESGEYVCADCVGEARYGTHYRLFSGIALEQYCARCGSRLHTSPSREQRVDALVEAEAASPGSPDFSRWLYHALPLSDEPSYMERIVAVAERAGIAPG